MTRIDCPYQPMTEKEEVKEEIVTEEKYKPKPPKELKSKFLMMMEQRKVDEENAEKAKEAEEERLRILEEEKRPPDDLDGQRVHAWVLMLPGKKDIKEAFFIEPSTGISYPLDTFMYNGIESVWNHQNYWVNMQDCSGGMGNMEYELMDIEKWEHLLLGEPIQWRKLKPRELEEEDAAPEIYDEKHLDMPFSWSMKINIPHDVLTKRFPDGSRITNYKRTIVEEYAPYVLDDGLVTRITRFTDFACTIPHTIEEVYENRQDKMAKIINDIVGEVVTEYFDPGREDGVIKHIWKGDQSAIDNPFNERTILFNSHARYDSLSKLEIQKSEIIEHNENREDKLYYKKVTYKEGSDELDTPGTRSRRPIDNIIEKFSRDPDKNADDDIAYRQFDITQRQIQLKFHYGKDHVTASTRTFIKPSISEMGEQMIFKPECTYGYQAELGAKPLSSLNLFVLFDSQLKEEDRSVSAVRDMENQILEFLTQRTHELAFAKLDVSLYNKERNIDYRLSMLEKEEQQRMVKEKEVEEDIDYLTPYLAKLGNPKKLTKKQAGDVANACINEFKTLLVNRANMIQKTFERASDQLSVKKAWYTTNHDNLTPDEEARYFEEVNNDLFVLHCLEIRLNRHKELSTLRYEALMQSLYNHPMLTKYRESL